MTRDALEVIQSKKKKRGYYNPGVVFSTSRKDGKRKPEAIQQFVILTLFSSS